jgi:hypothetical protein
LALALLAASPVAAGAADDLAVAVERKGDVFSVRARATLAAPAAVAWQVLTDYETLPRFIPGISTSVVLARSADRVVLEQRGEARFLVFSFPIEVRYEVRESPPHWVASRAIAGNLRHMSGRYDLNADTGRPGVRLDYSGEMEPDFELPPLVGAFALRNMVEAQFTAMVDEIERRAAPGR